MNGGQQTFQQMPIILVTDDSDQAAKIGGQFSSAGFTNVLWHLRSSDNATAFIDGLSHKSDTLMLCSYELDSDNGLQLCRRINKKWPEITTILIAQSGNDQLAVQAIKAGISHYFSQDKHNQYLAQLIDSLPSIWAEHQARVTVNQRKSARDQALLATIYDLKSRNAELDAFARTVAHDLKNPLSALSGLADLLSTDHNRMSDNERAQIGRTIAHCGNKALAIVDELLKLGQPAGSVTYEEVDSARLVESALFRLANLEGMISPIIHLPTVWPAATGYAPWIEEVWTNYISNAFKYGGQPCEIWLGGEYLDTGMTRFWVRDNGPGIELSDLNELFEPYRRFHTGPQEGHGLGLSIVRRIVNRHCGQVGAEPIAAGGTEFWFTLPTGDWLSETTTFNLAAVQSQPEPSHRALAS